MEFFQQLALQNINGLKTPGLGIAQNKYSAKKLKAMRPDLYAKRGVNFLSD